MVTTTRLSWTLITSFCRSRSRRTHAALAETVGRGGARLETGEQALL